MRERLNNRLGIGHVAGAHGVAGAVNIQLHDARSQALRSGVTLVLVRDGTQTQRVVERVDPVPGKSGRMRVRLSGVEDRDAAEALRGCAIEIEREALEPLGDDEFYLADAIGLDVQRLDAQGHPTSLGTIIGVMSNGPQDLFEIEWLGPHGRPQTWLLPVLPQFVRDVDDARVLVEVPPGLLPDELELET